MNNWMVINGFAKLVAESIVAPASIPNFRNGQTANKSNTINGMSPMTSSSLLNINACLRLEKPLGELQQSARILKKISGFNTGNSDILICYEG